MIPILDIERHLKLTGWLNSPNRIVINSMFNIISNYPRSPLGTKIPFEFCKITSEIWSGKYQVLQDNNNNIGMMFMYYHNPPIYVINNSLTARYVG